MTKIRRTKRGRWQWLHYAPDRTFRCASSIWGFATWQECEANAADVLRDPGPFAYG